MEPNILIVDDSRTVRSMLRRTIGLARSSTSSVHEASNGAEALELLGRVDVNLVFADIHMPVMDGVELIEKMRDDTRLTGVPVVVVSSDGAPERLAQLEQLGVQSFLRKPFRVENIRDVLNTTLGSDDDD